MRHAPHAGNSNRTDDQTNDQLRTDDAARAAPLLTAVGNYLRFRLGPQVAIALGGRVKRFGEGMTGRPVELSILEQPAAGMRGDYERLLDDAIAGDATLFARQDIVEAAWGIVNPLLQDPGAMFEYEPGSWGPAEADQLVADVGGWNTPA